MDTANHQDNVKKAAGYSWMTLLQQRKQRYKPSTYSQIKMDRTDSETRKCRSMVIKKGAIRTQTIHIEGSPIT